MATLTLVLETRRANKDGKFPLLFRIGLKRKYAYINTGIHLYPFEFNTKRSIITADNQLNTVIKQQEVKYLKKLHLLLGDFPHITDPMEIKSKLLEKGADEVTIKEFWEEHIETLYNAGRNGGAKVYQSSLSALSRHFDFNISFRKFTYRELIQLENRLFKSGVSVNGIGVYFRALRAILNKAINTDILSADYYPFRKYKIKKEKTTPRVLSMDELKRYFHLDLPVAHPDYIYWNLGRLIFMMRGINITDLLQLNYKSLNCDRIIYTRSKTGKLYSIAFTPELKKVLSLFHSDDTLLGIADVNFLHSRRKTPHLIQKRKVINKHLKSIGFSLGFKEELTTYVFRYTYANIAKQLGFSKDLIAEALGHEYGNSITGIYLEQFDLVLVDSMNQAILNAVMGKN
jgi:integrase/recombinase XerD